MKTPPTLEQDWPFLLTLLPADLEASARACGALQRKREIKSAAVLLRLALAYAFCGLSLQATVLWVRERQIASLSAVALFKRLRHAAPWFGHLLSQLLAQRAGLQPEQLPRPWRLRLVDATTVSRPGSTGTDYRLHLQWDLATFTIAAVTLTDVRGGESFKQTPLSPGELAVADRGYGHRQGIAAVVAAGAAVLVRLAWQMIPLQSPDGAPFDLFAALRSLNSGEVGDWEVQSAPASDGTPAVAGRLIAVRKSPQAAQVARRKLLADARRKGRTPDARSLEAAAYLFVFTTVAAAALPAGQALAVYRFRWQIELTFKRLKSLLALEELAAQDDALCRMFLTVKLLGAVLVEQLCHRWVEFFPLGLWTASGRCRSGEWFRRWPRRCAERWGPP
jgi:hypothetical protein